MGKIWNMRGAVTLTLAAAVATQAYVITAHASESPCVDTVNALAQGNTAAIQLLEETGRLGTTTGQVGVISSFVGAGSTALSVIPGAPEGVGIIALAGLGLMTSGGVASGAASFSYADQMTALRGAPVHLVVNQLINLKTPSSVERWQLIRRISRGIRSKYRRQTAHMSTEELALKSTQVIDRILNTIFADSRCTVEGPEITTEAIEQRMEVIGAQAMEEIFGVTPQR